MTRALLSLLSPAGARGRLTTLIFHRVLPVPDPLFPEEMHARRFDEICRWLASTFHVLPLDEAARRLQTGSLPARALSITFDDGYRDNHDVAMPILQRHGLSATFFIATGFLDGGRMWNDTIIESVRGTSADRLDLSDLGVEGLAVYGLPGPAERRAAAEDIIGRVKYLPVDERLDVVGRIAAAAEVVLPDDLMMSSGQVRAMHLGGMQIGAHTVTHPILATLPLEGQAQEMAASRAKLQQAIGAPVTMLAYPNGKPGRDYAESSVSIARELGFETAVSTAAGVADARSDPFQLPRFTPWDRTRVRFNLRIAAALARRPWRGMPLGSPA